MGWLFDWLRIAGAIYLAWLGWKLLRAGGGLEQPGRVPVPKSGFFIQGLLVLLANPKALLFFGAFIPQFVDPKGDYVFQIVLLGATAMAAALITDGGYAILTGRAATFLSRGRVRLASKISGAFLIAGGVWLALLRAR
jgi:threonine/homoserine/homoserine lactone efflux protein